MTKVAIITRTKDRPLFLKRAISSVASQTYRDYVHAIINDGGDQTDINQILEEVDNEVRSKIKLFHREVSSNAPDTIFNESIDRVDSEYVVIHDDDDTWHNDFLRSTVQHLDKNPQVAGVVVRTDKVIEEVRGQKVYQTSTSQLMPDVRVINLYRQCIDNQMTPIAFLFRRVAYEAVGKFDDTLPVVGDWEFGVRLLREYDVDFLDPGHALAYYHHRKFKPGAQGNTSFSGNDKHRYYSNLVMNRYLRAELSEGRMGVGYIMSELKYNQSYIAGLAKKILPGALAQRLKRVIQR